MKRYTFRWISLDGEVVSVQRVTGENAAVAFVNARRILGDGFSGYALSIQDYRRWIKAGRPKPSARWWNQRGGAA